VCTSLYGFLLRLDMLTAEWADAIIPDWFTHRAVPCLFCIPLWLSCLCTADTNCCQQIQWAVLVYVG
jgi:hypothetical protein